MRVEDAIVIPLPPPRDAEAQRLWEAYRAAHETAMALPSILNMRAALAAYDAFCVAFCGRRVG